MNSDYVKVKEKEVRGIKCTVYVRQSNGSFVIVPSGKDPGNYSERLGESHDMDEAVKRAMTKTKERSTQVAIPFILVEPTGEMRTGVARAIHAKSDDILVTWGDGKKDELPRFLHGRKVLKPSLLTTELVLEIQRAAETAAEAERQAARARRWLEALVKPYEIDRLSSEVEKAVRETVQKAIELEARKACHVEEAAAVE